MKMAHRFMLLALVVAALAQPVLAAHSVVEFQLDDSMDVAAYEETLPEGEVAEAFEQPLTKAIQEPVKPAISSSRATPTKLVVPSNSVPQDIPLIDLEKSAITSPEIRFITGGVGEDEARDIIASKPEYNLYIMSANEDGAFVGDARVVIGRKQGESVEVVLDVVAGPLLYVSLPSGSYTLSATLGAQTKRQSFIVKDKDTPRNIHLGWKTSAISH